MIDVETRFDVPDDKSPVAHLDPSVLTTYKQTRRLTSKRRRQLRQRPVVDNDPDDDDDDNIVITTITTTSTTPSTTTSGLILTPPPPSQRGFLSGSDYTGLKTSTTGGRAAAPCPAGHVGRGESYGARANAWCESIPFAHNQASKGRDHHGESDSEKDVLPTFRVCMDSPSGSPSGILARRGPEVEAPVNSTQLELSSTTRSSSATGPITGEDIDVTVLPAPRAIPHPPTGKCCRQFGGYFSRSRLGVDKDRISEGRFSASDLLDIDANIPVTDLNAHTASDHGTALDDYTASEYRAASDDIELPYDSELEISETQFDESDNDEETNVETGEMSENEPRARGCNTDHREEGAKKRVSVRALPFRRAGFVPPPMSFEESMI